MSAAIHLLMACSALLIGLAVLAPWLGTAGGRSTALVYGATAAVAAIALAAAGYALVVEAEASTLALPLGLPWLGAHFRLDRLAAFFLLIVNLGATAASVFAIGYGRHEEEPHRVLPFYPAFLASMNLVVLADDAFTFLLSWELMSLASWALVISGHRRAENVQAGYVYLIMAGFGTLALLLAFGLLAGADGGYDFASIRAAAHSPAIASLALLLMLVGAGSKAGLVPLHVWLPLAHPAAPSHVSALMSGVMTKIAVYGFLRVTLDLLGEPAWWAAAIVLLVGATSAVLGILSALMERDLKRMLAYSTIENVGIVFVAIGLAMAFHANRMELAAALSLTAALLHMLNHTLYKSALFFGAGAVLTATGERDLEKLGGLIHRLPYTSVAFLTASLAISALPPLNGFVSEWLVFQAVLQSPDLPQWLLKVMVPGIGGLLALAAALTAACFVRAFGIGFLGRPRTPAAGTATEVDRFSLAAMAALGALCLLIGILPGPVIDALSPVTDLLIGGRMPSQVAQPWLSIVPITESRSSYNGLLVFAFIAASAWIVAYAIHRLASRAVRYGPAWGCGFPDIPASAQYSAGSFAEPIRRVFGAAAFGARAHVEMPPPGDLRPAQFAVEMRDRVYDGLYAPVAGLVGYAAERLNLLQFLTIRRYLSLVFVLLVVLLAVLAL